MKHSKKESKPKGHSKGKNDDDLLRTGPIMIEDIMRDRPSHHKNHMAIRDLNIRADPTNDQPPVIRRHFKPLNDPRNRLRASPRHSNYQRRLRRQQRHDCGPNQHAFWHGCLTGTAQHKFIQFAREVGTETLANLLQVKQCLTTHFAPGEVPRKQKKHMRAEMRVVRNTTARQHVGAIATLNETLGKLPPDFNESSKAPGQRHHGHSVHQGS
jgi:hypothetical protein